MQVWVGRSVDSHYAAHKKHGPVGVADRRFQVGHCRDGDDAHDARGDAIEKWTALKLRNAYEHKNKNKKKREKVEDHRNRIRIQKAPDFLVFEDGGEDIFSQERERESRDEQSNGHDNCSSPTSTDHS